jgi:hypothetical protein
MAANTAPIFGRLPEAQWNTTNITAANTAKDGASGTVYDLFTAGVDGSYLVKMVIRPRGTNVATVMRVFVNNGSATTTAANNSLVAEITLPATTNTETAAINGVEVPLNMPLPGGYKLFATIGTGVAGGFSVTVFGADY